MALDYQTATLKFLYEPKTLACEVPAELDHGSPEIVATIGLTDQLARLIGYRRGRVPDSDDGHRLLYDTQRAGVPISVFRIDDPPPRLVAYWRLEGDGCLSTFMDDSPSGAGRAGLTAFLDGVGIGWIDGLPVVLLEDGLHQGDIREPDERERTEFFSASTGVGEEFTVYFRREPPWVAERAVTIGKPWDVYTGEEWVEVWAVGPEQVRISCQGPSARTDEFEEAVGHMAETLTVQR